MRRSVPGETARLIGEITRLVPAELILEVAAYRVSGGAYPRETGIHVNVQPGQNVVLIKVTADTLLDRLLILTRHAIPGTLFHSPWRVTVDTRVRDIRSDESEIGWVLFRLLPPEGWENITADCIGSLVRVPSADRLVVPP